MSNSQLSLVQLVGIEKAESFLRRIGLDPNDGTNLHDGLGLLLEELLNRVESQSKTIDGGHF